MYKIINSKYIWCPINGILKDHSILIKSNKIHRIDQYKNLKIKRRNGFEGIAVTGSPADCVKFGLKKVLSKNKLIKESIKQAIEECSSCGVTTIGEIASYNGLDI